MSYDIGILNVSGLGFKTSGDEADFGNAKSLMRVQTKTADYTVLESDSGTLFTTYGDNGTIVFTLPTNPKKGLYYFFFQSVNQTMTITNGTADTLITFNDPTADGMEASTSSQKTGALFFAFADGNAWGGACLSNGTTLTVNT